MTRPYLGYRLGLPAWGFSGWKDRFFTAAPSQLASYAQVFNTVEGNTTFYGIPDFSTVERWRRDVAGTDFEFCFKIPRSVTHERNPRWGDLKQFLDAVGRLGEHLGPFLVQFPAHLEPRHLPVIERLFDQLPACFRYVLELRHLGFFARPQLIEPLLEKYNAGLVMFDSRPLYQGDRNHPEVLAGKHQKPDVPVVENVHNRLVFVRLILHPDPQYNAAFVEEWLQRVTGYIGAGHAVYFMVHCPNNLHCPDFAEDFHRRLMGYSQSLALQPLPAWPIPRQEALF
ncbi:DUF72 domain-containing protein [Exilibacterium tricleocarpae]|uniref:DUF72 domain-containing protein n=1 Tax=Exilibacterium tricleocarpae TaxID=2591008 RepID=A0A545TAD6_9GAMM|nr:DUF72 domain-containing protein [Exilibacterium tricleocarpae]TQV74182.1 DUF72 domain-containing protein [Exilibacterium tricleocarpae]